MIVLVNFNSYLGGGETLFLRMAKYLSDNGEKIKLFYLNKSYIADDIKRVGILEEALCPYSMNINYYYLNKNEKQNILMHFVRNLQDEKNIKLISFCYRDLYLLVDVAKTIKDSTIIHLILHDEDNLYLCQTLVNKLQYRFLKKKKFSNNKLLEFNNKLFYELNVANALIGEKETTKIVMRRYGIELLDSVIVPPPMCEFDCNPPFINKGKRILWIGRFVDFKLPAIVSMLEFISVHRDYTLSLIGDGDMAFIKRIAKERRLDLANVKFLGQQSYDKIGEIIKEHSIGYACGTSIVEIGKYGLPVITALFSPYHKLYSKSICGGLYNNKYKGNEGNNLLVGETEDQQPLIETVIAEIENDFDGSRQKSYDCMKADFTLSTNMKKYLIIINNAKSLDYSKITIPSCNFFRRIIYNFFYK